MVVFHPLFGGMPEDPRLRIAFLSLDWALGAGALGEQAVEVWIGEISATATPPTQRWTLWTDCAARWPTWLRSTVSRSG